MSLDRRSASRIPVELPLIQFVDNHPFITMASNLSTTGLHACHLLGPMIRSSRMIQLELPLPGLYEPLWAKGEIVYDSIGPVYHGTGIKLLAMATRHRRALDSWLEKKRYQHRPAGAMWLKGRETLVRNDDVHRSAR